MTKFKVWDELNGDLSDADDIEAVDAQAAAEKFAAYDQGGHTDGLYQHPQPIMVVEPDGSVRKFMVELELTPSYRATEVK